MVMCLGLFGCEDNSKLKKLGDVNISFDQNEMDVWLTQIVHDKMMADESLAWFRALAINLALHLKLHNYTLPCGCEQPLLPEDMTPNGPLSYASK